MLCVNNEMPWRAPREADVIWRDSSSARPIHFQS